MREDWIEIPLGEVLSVSSGKGLTSKKMSGAGFPVYGGNGITGYHSAYIYNEQKLIIGRVGVRCGVTHITKSKSWITDNALIVDFKIPFFDLMFMKLKLQFENLNKLSNSTAQPVISGAKIYAYSIQLPPLAEQRAIVSKIEILFSDLDNGIADLKKAQEQLKIYRQVVLKKAFEGELTKEWGATQTNLPTAKELLEQIKEERQKHYEQQLENWKQAVKTWEENGKEGKKPGKPQKTKHFEVLTKSEINELPRLPNNWFWEKLGNVCLKIMDGTHFSPKNIASGDFKYITAKNIKEGHIVLDNISFVTKEDHLEIYSRCDVKKGDVLYIKDGATTGKAAINNLKEEFSLLSSVGVFRTAHNLILPQYLEYFLNSHTTRNRMLSNIAGVAITRLTLVKLNNSLLSVCSLQEQNQIVREIETRLSVCDKVEQSISQGLEKARALRQSILKKAFEGSLLSNAEIEKCKQEADYESASVLLERIREEQEKNSRTTSNKKKKTKTH